MKNNLRKRCWLLVLFGAVFFSGCKAHQSVLPDRAAVAFVAAHPPPTRDAFVRILTYGLRRSSDAEDMATNVVASNWGMEYHCVAGCMVSQELIDSVERHNAEASRRLYERHGAGWKEAIEKEVPAELQREKLAARLLQKQLRRERKAILRNRAPVYYTKFGPARYLVSLKGPAALNQQPFLYRYLVDLKTRRVALVTDSTWVVNSWP